MKKIILLLIIFSLSCTAQTHRFIYEYHFKTDSTSTEKRKVSMVLDINPQDIKFFNYEYVKTDSLNKIRNERNSIWDDTPALIRKKNSNINSNYVLVQNIFVVDTEDNINWNLAADTKVVAGYTLQKATAQYGGRTWTAWFTKEITINEGPYKFRGLPGLIFEIYDNKDNFKFSLIKSYKLTNTYETRDILEHFGGQNPVKISESKLKKMMLDSYNDPLHEFKEHYKNNTDPGARFMVMGIEVKSADQFKDLSEKLQSSLRKNNNPIELNKAIHYPER